MDYSGWYFTISPHRSLIDEYSCFNNGEPLIKISTFDKSNYQYAMSQQSANDISEETFKDKSYTVTIPPNNTFNRLKYYTVKGKYNLLEILYFPGACLYKDKNYDEELHSILGSLQFTEIATGNKGTLDDVSIINWKKPPIQIN